VGDGTTAYQAAVAVPPGVATDDYMLMLRTGSDTKPGADWTQIARHINPSTGDESRHSLHGKFWAGETSITPAPDATDGSIWQATMILLRGVDPKRPFYSKSGDASEFFLANQPQSRYMPSLPSPRSGLYVNFLSVVGNYAYTNPQPPSGLGMVQTSGFLVMAHLIHHARVAGTAVTPAYFYNPYTTVGGGVDDGVPAWETGVFFADSAPGGTRMIV
jgi:hypothetical protein